MNNEIKRRLTILDIVAKHCLCTGVEKAAQELHGMDISRDDFVETMRRCPTVPDDLKCNIENSMSNLERGLNVMRPRFNHKQARRRLRESLKPSISMPVAADEYSADEHAATVCDECGTPAIDGKPGCCCGW